MGEPQVLAIEGLPTADEAPRFVKKAAPPYPAAWKKHTPLHVAFVDVRVSEKGKVIETAIHGWKQAGKELDDVVSRWRFSPAKRQGRPIEASCRIAVLFNPETAAARPSETSPRIEEAAFLTAIPALDRNLNSPRYAVRARVDSSGKASVLELQAMSLEPPDPEALVVAKTTEVTDAAKAMIESWKFSPAHSGGQPVAREIEFHAIIPNANALYFEIPKLLVKAPLVYPNSLKKSGNIGEVDVAFIVDERGRVVSPTVLKSSHPDFEAPAIASILKWSFAPGTVRGKPVRTRMIQPVAFRFEGMHGADPYRIKGSSKKDLPEKYRYDRPPQPKIMVTPVYPFEALKEGKKGSATVTMLIDETGKVAGVRVDQTSSPEFGDSAAAAARASTFIPAQLDGKPTQTLVAQAMNFQPEDRDSGLDATGRALLQRIQQSPSTICALRDLDAKPVSKFKIAPIYTGDMPTGVVEVAFYIDRTGRVHFPHAARADDPKLIYPALTAVARWQFEPPLKEGKPTEAFARMPISFGTPPAAK